MFVKSATVVECMNNNTRKQENCFLFILVFVSFLLYEKHLQGKNTLDEFTPLLPISFMVSLDFQYPENLTILLSFWYERERKACEIHTCFSWVLYNLRLFTEAGFSNPNFPLRDKNVHFFWEIPSLTTGVTGGFMKRVEEKGRENLFMTSS